MEKEFDFKVFKEEYKSGDLNGLEYLENTLIKEYKEKYKNNYDPLYYTQEEFIVNLFEAVMCLNLCNTIYERKDKTNIKKFNYDYYATIRDLLFIELGFDLEKLYN